ncbi:hypothetical protein KUTeg_005625 [Tegillarca granosa]|uniref:Uncharacterized protein n=1 Tax=Tegillarca granosa TaxID=220873 RepID=A0ABQ9FK89_TEGGR|nr:hypothetical protein KUTeg_005625 [Tegillarca granosa]
MFGFEQLVHKTVRNSESYVVEGRRIQPEQTSGKRVEDKTKSVFDIETQPFDADEVEVMDSSTQVDEESGLSTPNTPTKDNSLMSRQIEKGKQLFDKFCTSASKLKGRFSRKRKAEESLDENLEKGGKKQHEMDREIEETSGDQKSENFIFQREVFEPCEPLCRKYRKMRLKSSTFTSASGIQNVDVHIKAILQYFDIYHKKLKQVQSQIPKTMEWGEPVRVGQHLDKTIDCRRRGYVYDFLDSDSENICDHNEEIGISFASESTEKMENLKDKNQENEEMIKTFNRKNIPFRFSDDYDDFENDGKSCDQTNQTYNRLGRVTRSTKKITYYEENQSSPEHDPEWIQIMEKETQDIQHSPDIRRQKRQEKSKPSHTLSRRPLTRHASDLSNKSPVTSPVSSTQSCYTGRLESPSKVSESSLDGLSQGSSLMLDDKGDLISTQVCVLKEKLPNLKVKPMINKTITHSKSKSATGFIIDGNGSVETSVRNKVSVVDKTDDNLIENYKKAEKIKKIPIEINSETNKASSDLDDGVNLIDSDSENEISFKHLTSSNKTESSFSSNKSSVSHSAKKRQRNIQK